MMEICMASYLDRIGAGLVINDPTPLEYEFVPNELKGRDTELGRLATLFSGIDRPGVSRQALLTGPVGSGKTVTARTFGRDLERHLAPTRPLKVARVNCRSHPTMPQVLQRIITSIDARHPERGFGSGEILQSLRRQLLGAGLHLLVILDEVDHLIIRDGADLIYQLLRIDEEHEATGSISLIMISVEPIIERLEPSIISRLGRSNALSLSSYTVDELEAIIEQRAHLALSPASFDQRLLRLIAEAAGESGDARVAIELLSDAAKEAENRGQREIRSSDVQSYAAESRPSSAFDPAVIDELSQHCRLILLAISRRLKREPEISTGEVENLYHIVCEEFEVKPCGHTTVWNHLNHLREIGAIERRHGTTGKGRGRTQHFSMPTLIPGVVVQNLERQCSR
ncbi:MAG: hypothetical protein CMB77_08020 [Euryarchaeota archaeon]|nr:hypothetical protein [Euryarchaeota archaeon]